MATTTSIIVRAVRTLRRVLLTMSSIKLSRGPAPSSAETYVPLPRPIKAIPIMKAVSWNVKVSGFGMLQLKKSINRPTVVILINVPILGKFTHSDRRNNNDDDPGDNRQGSDC